MPLLLDCSAARFTSSSAAPLSIDLGGVTPDRIAGCSAADAARLVVSADGRPVALGDVCQVSGDGTDGRIELHGDCSRLHFVGAGMRWGEIVVHGAIGRHAGEGMEGGRLAIGGNAGDWLAAEMKGGTVHVRGDAGDNVAAALPGSEHGMRGGVVMVEGGVGALAAARMRRGILAVGGGCGPAAAFEMRAGTVLVVGPVGRHAGMAMRRGSVVAVSTRPDLPATFRRGATWLPTFLPLLGSRLQRLGFRPLAAAADAFHRPWQQWHGDFLTGGRGEIFHAATTG
jgi:formylmethanofuran dehydrogenase subunit C